MINLYQPDGKAEAASPIDAASLQDAVWIDLDSPTSEERRLVEQALAVSLPTTDDLEEIEASSRVYREDGGQYMTALVVTGIDSGKPISVPVGFILAPGGQLVTLRFATPQAFRSARQLAARADLGTSGQDVLVRLLDLVVDRKADTLELLAARIDETSATIFGRNAPPDHRLSHTDLQMLLRDIGNNQYVLNKVHEALMTLARVVSFLTATWDEAADGAASGRERLRSLARDISSLNENSAFLMRNVFFLLDSTVGRISIEQNIIIKLLSLASIVLMPPTLIAGIYGMNFEFMPELSYPLSYPIVLLVMLASAIGPLWYSRRKGWL